MKRPIPREDWIDFCDSFTRRHEGWLVDVDVTTSGSDTIATEVETSRIDRGAPLLGVTAELLRDEGQDDRVIIITGQGDTNHMDHTIREPTAIVVEQSREGAEEGLIIDSASSGRTLLKLRAGTATAGD